MPGVSVAMPVRRWDRFAGPALRSVLAQSFRDLDILLLPEPSHAPTRRACEDAARTDPRVRVIERERPGLPAALNTALREARHDLVARMDADDLCAPQRIERQVEFMGRNPRVVALGTAGRRIDDDDAPLGVEVPPCRPETIRWRLVLGNVFVHGSMVLRRDAVLDAGGYDEAYPRGQDYELWLRLSERHALANLPDVVYEHRAPRAGGPDTEQGSAAAALMRRAWERLPTGDHAALEHHLADALACPDARGRAADAIERTLDHEGPSRAALMAWLWAERMRGIAPRGAYDIARLARAREVLGELSRDGVASLWLWGAGAHSEFLLAHADDLDLEIRGIVDDHRAGAVLGRFHVESPDAIPAGEHALLSSDHHEDALWCASAHCRERGVVVHRLYAPLQAEAMP